MEFSFFDNALFILFLTIPVGALAWLVGLIVRIVNRKDKNESKKLTVQLIISGILLLTAIACSVFVSLVISEDLDTTGFYKTFCYIFGLMLFFGLPVWSFVWFIISLVKYIKCDKDNKQMRRKRLIKLIITFIVWLLITLGIMVIEFL